MSEWAEFGGEIGRYRRDSKPWWPEPVRAQEGAPNVAVFLLDDVGFAQLGCFGSDIDTPNLDRLAADGSALHELPHDRAVLADARVPPDRAQPSLRRHGAHHRPGDGLPRLLRPHPEVARLPPRDARAQRLRHVRGRQVAPHARRRAPPRARARDRWPLGRGFQRWYGYFGGETHQFAPALALRQPLHRRSPARTTRATTSPRTSPTRPIEFLADLQAAEPEQPFFLYFCTGACHSPHHAPPEWIERYRGRFDDGWDAWREAHLRPPAGRWASCPRAPSSRPGRVGAGVGLALRRRAAAGRTLSWSASPRSSPRRPADRPGARLP